MNIKQLLLTTALITSLSSAAIAEITISGAAKVNTKGEDHTIEADLTITGKSGDTSVVAQIGVDNSNMVEQLYMTSKVAGIDIKAGTWKSGKGELGRHRTSSEVNGIDKRIEVSTLFGGVKLTYEDWSGAGGTKIAVSGKIGGFETMIKRHTAKTEAKLSGSIGGIDIDTHVKDHDAGHSDTSVTLKTSVQGVDLTYVNTTSFGTEMDGFMGIYHPADITKASAFGISTNILGNKVTYKAISADGVGDVNQQQLIITRKLSSGSTFEVTYKDANLMGDEKGLDLELAVKF